MSRTNGKIEQSLKKKFKEVFGESIEEKEGFIIVSAPRIEGIMHVKDVPKYSFTKYQQFKKGDDFQPLYFKEGLVFSLGRVQSIIDNFTGSIFEFGIAEGKFKAGVFKLSEDYVIILSPYKQTECNTKWEEYFTKAEIADDMIL